jgi:hypothetical protein
VRAPRADGASGVRSSSEAQEAPVLLCTSICGSDEGRSCSKTVLVDVYFAGFPSVKFRTYAIIDEQSSHSFATSELFDFFKIRSCVQSYSVSTLAGSKISISGRIASGLSIKGVSEDTEFVLPRLFENSMIPDGKEEIATVEEVARHPILSHLSHHFLPLDDSAPGALLIGRNAGECDLRN